MNAQGRNYPGINLDHEPQTHAEAEEKVFGFWVFLMSDLVLFALLFATYATMTGATAGGPSGGDVFELKSTMIETGLLLASSFTFGMASLEIKYGGKGRLFAWLAVTLLFGALFLGFEWRDFATMIAQGAPPSRSGFLSAFFVLVGTHGLHVTAGCVWIVVMMAQIAVFGTARDVKIRMLRLGLFWHFLDIVWIAIFSVVYLPGLVR
ncbi:MAG: cytochrome o ubiquinol oxidase subunit III [Rhodopseudomonas sp.]|nr:cytochrome o ubiquinol oxidase subunit III [Rhodopseudomonas sp.]